MGELPSTYQQYVHLSRYSRWLPEKKRRENWEETVKRYFDFFVEHLKEKCNYSVTIDERKELEEAVLRLEVLPSMRALMSSGEALKRDNISAFNCSFIAIDSPRAFDEIMYILMCGTGCGFSVERQFINQLPSVPDALYDTETTIIVADSKIGWAKALKELIQLLYCGQIAKWDLSKVRAAGTPLKIFGGRASGPEPLDRLFHFVVKVFKQSVGRKLTSLECHDIVCKIAEMVICGGVRRSATISLSNLSDERMRTAKSGQWWIENAQRALANNSVAYTDKPDMGIFLTEWKALYDSKSGERGIFNRAAAIEKAKENEKRDLTKIVGVNPCGEIILRNKGVCNLSEVVIRESDTEKDLIRKVRLATILGTWQATLTKFRYLVKEWQTNAEEEALLGVSLTGIMDNKLTNNLSDHLKTVLKLMKEKAVQANKEWAKKLKINPAAAITTVKPSGTVSQLVNSASGIHARHSKYYIRTVRSDNKDPLCRMMNELGFPNEPDIMNPDHTTVFSFPVESPENSILRNSLSAVQQLEYWLFYRTYWAEHNVSITVSVKEHEWLEVAAFVYNHFNQMTGVSFLPYSESNYKQLPYQECTKEDYYKLLERMPKEVDWNSLSKYESQDNTTSVHELSCTANHCDIQ